MVHGYEISLPLSNVQHLPSAWQSFPVDDHWCIYYSDGIFQDEGPMDWGGGNKLYDVMSNSCIPDTLSVSVKSGGHYQTVGQVTGYFSHIEPGMVRGTVELSAGPYVLNASYDIVLALQVQDDTGWHDAATREMQLMSYPTLAEVQAVVQPNSQVRLEIRAFRDYEYQRTVIVHQARLFGAQCYPDFADPTKCL